MLLELKDTPRKFKVNDIEIKDFGKINLAENEMLSFKTSSGKEFDFTAKKWGFYVTPSINGRLQKEGFKSAFTVNEYNKTYIMSVEIDKLEEFREYLKSENIKLICWLDEMFKE